MRLRGSLVVFVVIGCRGPSKPPTPPVVGGGDVAGDIADAGTDAAGTDAGGDGGAMAAPALPAAPADLARADLVTLREGTVTGYAIVDGALVALGATELATVDPDDYPAHLRGDWADREHLFVRVAEREVVMITPTAITRVAVPPPTAFAAPRPKTDDDEGLTEGGVMERSATGLVVADGAAWWVECPWGFPYDGWQCEVWRRAQLWPQPQAAAEADSVDATAWTWPAVTVSGYRTKDLDGGRLRCTPPGARPRPTEFAGDDSQEEVYGHHWVSAAPPRLLVIYGQFGLADLVPSRWTLHDGCRPTPLAAGTSVEPGPRGLWLTDEPSADEVPHQRLRRGAEVVGELPNVDVRFRPPAP